MNLKRKINEVKYLTVENSERYRGIVKCLFDSFNEMRYWLYKEEIFEVVKTYPRFQDYTMEQLKLDLDTLFEYKNIIADEDSRNVSTIFEFKNKDFKYQISKVSIEIERMLVVLESIMEESNSYLNANFMIKFINQIEDYEKIKLSSPKEMFQWWFDLKNNFEVLNNNYTNFISYFSYDKFDNILKVEEFLIFKERFLKYLEEFVKEMRLNYSEIADIFKNKILPEKEALFENIYKYEVKISGFQIVEKDEYILKNIERLKRMSN